MRSPKRPVIALLLILASISCATVGPAGDATLVRAEDLLSNSLSVYNAAMTYHFANSTKESPSTYKTFERVRTGFPEAWKALYDGTRTYKASPDPVKLNKLIAALQKMLDDVAPLIGCASPLGDLEPFVGVGA